MTFLGKLNKLSKNMFFSEFWGTWYSVFSIESYPDHLKALVPDRASEALKNKQSELPYGFTSERKEP